MMQLIESDVCMIEIRIPLINSFASVLYSPFHRWEHLFIKNLKYNINNYYEIYGQTDKQETLITILISPSFSESINKKLISKILHKEIDPEIINFELNILDNEISFLSTIMKKKLMKYSDIEKLNYMEILRFRENSYDWINLSITKTMIPKASFQNDTKESMTIQSLLDSKRDEMIDRFYQDRYIESDSENINDNRFLLICTPLNVKCKTEISTIFNILNDNQGFFKNYFNVRNYYTNVHKPSIEYKNQRFYITLFVFVKVGLLSDIVKNLASEIYEITKRDLMQLSDTIIIYG